MAFGKNHKQFKMSISEKTTIKYFDIVISELNDPLGFNINNILIENEHLKIDNSEQQALFFEIIESIEKFGLKYRLFEKIGENGWYELTDKGIELKDFKKGYEKFIKKSKSQPLTKYQIIYLTFFICFGLFGVFKVFQPTVSISEFNKLKADFDSLKTDFDSNDKSNSKSILELSNDTLQTKTLTNLETD